MASLSNRVLYACAFGVTAFVCTNAAHAVSTNYGNASIGIYIDGQGGPLPTDPNGEHNVTLGTHSNVTTASGTIAGVPSCPVAPCVQFTTTDPNKMDTSSAGIVAHGANQDLSELNISVPGYQFHDFGFKINFDQTFSFLGGQDPKLSITVNYGTSSSFTTAFGDPPLINGGTSTFLIMALGADDITSIELTSVFGSYFGYVEGFDSAGNFLISGDVAINPLSSTPLPAALPLFASGLGALGVFGLRRKRKAQATA
jgi:hypothetical protein